MSHLENDINMLQKQTYPTEKTKEKCGKNLPRESRHGCIDGRMVSTVSYVPGKSNHQATVQKHLNSGCWFEGCMISQALHRTSLGLTEGSGLHFSSGIPGVRLKAHFQMQLTNARKVRERKHYFLPKQQKLGQIVENIKSIV